MSAFTNFYDISDDSEEDEGKRVNLVPKAIQRTNGSDEDSTSYKLYQKSKLAKEREAAEERVRGRRLEAENSRKLREEEKQAKLALLEDERKRIIVQEELNALDHAYPNPQRLLDSGDVLEKQLAIRAALKQEFIDAVSNAEDILLMTSVVEEFQRPRR
jgi:hypothetical protein